MPENSCKINYVHFLVQQHKVQSALFLLVVALSNCVQINFDVHALVPPFRLGPSMDCVHIPHHLDVLSEIHDGHGVGEMGKGWKLPSRPTFPGTHLSPLLHSTSQSLAFRGKLGPFYISCVVHCYPNRFIHQHINTKCNVSSIGLLQIHSKQIKDVAIYCLQLLNPSCEMLDGLC